MFPSNERQARTKMESLSSLERMPLDQIMQMLKELRGSVQGHAMLIGALSAVHWLN